MSHVPSQAETKSELFSSWISTFITGLRKRCPACREGSIFKSYYKLHDTCPHCKVEIQPYAGDTLGVIAVTYFATVIPALLALFFAYVYCGASIGVSFLVFMLTTGLVLFGTYPNFTGLWVGLVYLMTEFSDD